MSSSTSGASRVPAFVREKLKKIDQFVSPQMDENSRSELGGFFSVLVPIGLLIYSIYLVVAFSDRPYTATSSVVTARGLGTVALPITCEFQFGCRLKEIQLSEDGAACMGEGRTLAYKQTATIQLCTGKAVLVTVLNTWLFAEGVQTVQYTVYTGDASAPQTPVLSVSECQPDYFSSDALAALETKITQTESRCCGDAELLLRKSDLVRDTESVGFAEFVGPTTITQVLYRASKTNEAFTCIEEDADFLTCSRALFRIPSSSSYSGATKADEVAKLRCDAVGSRLGVVDVRGDSNGQYFATGCFAPPKLVSLEGGLPLSYSFGKGSTQVGIVVEKVSKDDTITDHARDYSAFQLTDPEVLTFQGGTCFLTRTDYQLGSASRVFVVAEDPAPMDSLLIGLAGFHFQTNFTRPGDVLSLPGEIGGFKGTLETVFGLLLTAIGVVMQRFFAKAADAPREKPDGAISMKNPMATAL